jgi:hypothetical protein
MWYIFFRKGHKMTPTQQRLENLHTHQKMLESGAIGTLGQLLNGVWVVKVGKVPHITLTFGHGKNQKLQPLRRSRGGGWEVDNNADWTSAVDVPVYRF